ncbi:hypothetical protein HER21_34770, partial [Pseudomonas sp. BGM005]|nr:hypothetical protein [Pseudomonas sp. BG5]
MSGIAALGARAVRRRQHRGGSPLAAAFSVRYKEMNNMQKDSTLNDDRTGVSLFGGSGALACGGLPVRASIGMGAL